MTGERKGKICLMTDTIDGSSFFNTPFFDFFLCVGFNGEERLSIIRGHNPTTGDLLRLNLVHYGYLASIVMK